MVRFQTENRFSIIARTEIIRRALIRTIFGWERNARMWRIEIEKGAAGTVIFTARNTRITS
jgi:hypothetical protein